MNKKDVSFQEIIFANQTMCLTEILMFCRHFDILVSNITSIPEIARILKVITRNAGHTNTPDLQQDAFCIFLCHLAISIYSRY